MDGDGQSPRERGLATTVTLLFRSKRNATMTWLTSRRCLCSPGLSSWPKSRSSRRATAERPRPRPCPSSSGRWKGSGRPSRSAQAVRQTRKGRRESPMARYPPHGRSCMRPLFCFKHQGAIICKCGRHSLTPSVFRGFGKKMEATVQLHSWQTVVIRTSSSGCQNPSY